MQTARADETRPLLVTFVSERCGRCRRVDAYLAQVLQRSHNHDTFRVLRVDAERRPEYAVRFGVAELPTYVVIEGRKVRGRLEAPRNSHEVEVFLAPWLRCTEVAVARRQSRGDPRSVRRST